MKNKDWGIRRRNRGEQTRERKPEGQLLAIGPLQALSRSFRLFRMVA